MDLSRKENRQKLAIDLDTENTKARKQWSLRSSEVQGGRIEQYVKESLEAQFNIESVKEMPIVSSINIQKAVVDKKATIYKKKPERTFSDLSDQQIETVNNIYRDACINEKLNKSNKNYIYQDQSIGMLVPKNGKYICRIFKMHQIDALADMDDPETAGGYIISTFDRTDYVQRYQEKKDIDTATGVRNRSVRSSANEVESDTSNLADDYQYRKYVMKYIVWTPMYNFMMNGLGELLDPETGEVDESVDIISPLADENMMPFFEISRDKDYEYFVRPSNTLTDFTVQFNVALSDLQNNCKLNGYSVGILKAPSELQPNNIVIGAAMLLKLDTDDPEKEVDFSFASPSSSIGEISDCVDRMLNYFTTSEGLGGEVINSSGSTEQYTSGIDRFIAGVSRVEAHIDDYEKFRNVEIQIWNILKAWNRVLATSDQIDNKYKLGSVNEESEISIEFAKPEMVQTERERLDTMQAKIDLGIMSKVDAIMEYKGIEDREEAKKVYEEIMAEKMDMIPTLPMMESDSEDEEDDNGGDAERDEEDNEREESTEDQS